MAQVTLHMLKPEYMGIMYKIGIDNQLNQAKALLTTDAYEQVKLETITSTTFIIADELFDLTNNPSRQEEREKVYGRGRSLSVGDIVEAWGVKLLCCTFGWKLI
jgi:hypothetical protein